MKAILVNVFGGIVNCATIANGIVNASKSISLDLPLVVRLEGKGGRGRRVTDGTGGVGIGWFHPGGFLYSRRLIG